jgi:hypothetical protein
MTQIPDIFHGTVLNGKLKLDNRQGFSRLVQMLEGREIEIRLAKRRKARSSPQNRFYWGVLIRMMSEHTGHLPDEVHEGFKHHFLVDRIDTGLPRVRSTSSLTTEEFSRYVDDCVQLSAEMGVIVPDPASVCRINQEYVHVVQP